MPIWQILKKSMSKILAPIFLALAFYVPGLAFAQNTAPFLGGFSEWSQKMGSLRFTADREVVVSYKGQSRSRHDHVVVDKNKDNSIHYLKNEQGHLPAMEIFAAPNRAQRVDPPLLYDYLSTRNVIYPLIDKTTNHWMDFWQNHGEQIQWEKKSQSKIGKRAVDHYTLLGKGDHGFSATGEFWVDQESSMLMKMEIHGQYEQEPESDLYQKLELPPFLIPLEESLKGGPFTVKFSVVEKVENINQEIAIALPWIKPVK